jgi:hypothetical protein
LYKSCDDPQQASEDLEQSGAEKMAGLEAATGVKTSAVTRN